MKEQGRRGEQRLQFTGATRCYWFSYRIGLFVSMFDLVKLFFFERWSSFFLDVLASERSLSRDQGHQNIGA